MKCKTNPPSRNIYISKHFLYFPWWDHCSLVGSLITDCADISWLSLTDTVTGLDWCPVPDSTILSALCTGLISSLARPKHILSGYLQSVIIAKTVSPANSLKYFQTAGAALWKHYNDAMVTWHTAIYLHLHILYNVIQISPQRIPCFMLHHFTLLSKTVYCLFA